MSDLLQERAYDESGDPWRLLTVCCLLNATPGGRLVHLLPALWRLVPRAASLVEEGNFVEVSNLVRPLGLVRHRTKALREMTEDYLARYATEVRPSLEVGFSSLGPRLLRPDGSPWIRWVGRYAWESHELFVMRRALVSPPGDAVLRRRARELGLCPREENT